HVEAWRFWRKADDVVTEDLEGTAGDRWQRDGKTLFHLKVFHPERRAIAFQTADLEMIGLGASWTSRAMLIDPELLPRLSPRSAGWRNGYPFRRYAGKVHGVAWDVMLRLDMLLPVLIEQRRGGTVRLTSLEAAYALDDAPWAPTPG